MSLFFRLAFYAVLGALFSLIFGWGGWAILILAAIGLVIGAIQMELELKTLIVVIAAILTVFLAVIGVGTLSIGWLVVGTVVALVLFLLELNDAFTPSPSPSRA